MFIYGLVCCFWCGTVFIDLGKLRNQRQAKSNWSVVLCGKVLHQWVALRALSLGTALLPLVSGGHELPKHGEDAVIIGNLAHRGWTKWRNGHSVVILKFQKFQGGVSILGTLEANKAHSAALLCAGRGFWESEGLHSSRKLNLHVLQLWFPPSKFSHRKVFSFPVSYWLITDSIVCLIHFSPDLWLPNKTVWFRYCEFNLPYKSE